LIFIKRGGKKRIDTQELFKYRSWLIQGRLIRMRYLKKNEEAVTPVLAVILLVAITVIVAVIIAVFMFGVGAPADAPQAKLRFVATNETLDVYHEGGDPLIGKDSKVIINDAITTDAYTLDNGETLDVVLTSGGDANNDTFVPGERAQASWDSAPDAGDIIFVQVMDTPTGQMVANVKVVVN
jgi:flagellin-like protein